MRFRVGINKLIFWTLYHILIIIWKQKEIKGEATQHLMSSSLFFCPIIYLQRCGKWWVAPYCFCRVFKGYTPLVMSWSLQLAEISVMPKFGTLKLSGVYPRTAQREGKKTLVLMKSEQKISLKEDIFLQNLKRAQINTNYK